ncbi:MULTISPECIES: DEAD/DEAH box helicase [unclassified Mucilaginibacter]|uniref:DEAD/DEAH box helicase n=1 Tax=unclassified Mucilaginibacter TaxID=2617802 RepID=UPI002AC9BEF2|nr:MULTISPECIES: DEAD/DEAH box helicase [unclassified Mucilaginibacter]MEB0260248.1 DEAD/DEAH box helicase [Mucilaginibacter sp. 10I4]MEB0277341.1 DEAD/DEAH box helicase [Mucilaginibacter sp. 10B2]MEB0300177.1 DEAD/DEAH box helicase [Mucilaginibacter sp. 5C4]WPX25466.1 DEAD/DEAH box helicase [Mucilaginibacter sp. 5C4]
MAWAEKFKLNKQLIKSVTEAGFDNPKEIQLKTLNRIIGGQDVVAIGPEGCGKTTVLVLATLNRFKHSADGVPKALVLAPDQEKVFEILAQFDRLNRNKTIRIVSLHPGQTTEQNMDDLADGSDIVVATPDRARAIYLKLGLNLNKVDFFAVDDAQLIVKKGLQLPVVELANSIGRAQRLVFTEVMHAKLEKMIAPFMLQPATIEVEEMPEELLPVHPQILYHVPNFGTKVNLLNLFLYDEELFTKTVVFTNTRLTAETIYKSLHNRLRTAVTTINPMSFEYNKVNDIAEFKADSSLRVLIVANEGTEHIDVTGIPFIIHLDLPAEKEVYIQHIENHDIDAADETLALTFATDLELDQVRKIEQTTGQKMQKADLPDDLVMEKDRKQKEEEKEKIKKHTKTDPNQYVPGEAFHEKKPENSKTYNYSSGTKAKMNMKKKHG